MEEAEVEDLLRNIAGEDADGLRASQFLASQASAIGLDPSLSLPARTCPPRLSMLAPCSPIDAPGGC